MGYSLDDSSIYRLSIEKVANGFIVTMADQKFVFRTYAQASKFMSKVFSGKDQKGKK